jgi:hypothetical protein
MRSHFTLTAREATGPTRLRSETHNTLVPTRATSGAGVSGQTRQKLRQDDSQLLQRRGTQTPDFTQLEARIQKKLSTHDEAILLQKCCHLRCAATDRAPALCVRTSASPLLSQGRKDSQRGVRFTRLALGLALLSLARGRDEGTRTEDSAQRHEPCATKSHVTRLVPP